MLVMGEGAAMILCAVAEPVIDEDEGGHGFDDGDGAWEDAGVVATAALEAFGLAIGADGILFAHDGGGGFKGGAEEERFTIGDAALDTAGAVRAGTDVALTIFEGVVVLAAAEACTGEAATDFEAFGGRDGEHGFGEVGLEAVEDRFAESGGHGMYDSADNATDAIAFGADLFDPVNHAPGGFRMGASDGGGFNLLEGGV